MLDLIYKNDKIDCFHCCLELNNECNCFLEKEKEKEKRRKCRLEK